MWWPLHVLMNCVNVIMLKEIVYSRECSAVYLHGCRCTVSIWVWVYLHGCGCRVPIWVSVYLHFCGYTYVGVDVITWVWVYLRGCTYMVCSGGYRIFPRRGRQLPGGHQHTILPKFPKNCMKLKEFGPPGGGASPAPPFRSATGMGVLT